MRGHLWRHLSPRSGVVGLTAVSGLLAGCSLLPGGTDMDGPVSLHGDSGEICMPSNGPGQYALRMDVLNNTSSEPATIRSVSLVAPEGVELADAYVMGITDMTLVGVQAWPPSLSVQDPTWKARVPAPGATVPAGARNTTNLVLHLVTAPGGTGTLAAHRVSYEAGGRPYRTQTTMGVVIREKCF